MDAASDAEFLCLGGRIASGHPSQEHMHTLSMQIIRAEGHDLRGDCIYAGPEGTELCTDTGFQPSLEPHGSQSAGPLEAV